MRVPLSLIAGDSDRSLPTAPRFVARLTRKVSFVARSRTYTSDLPFVSASSSGPSQVNATRRPLSLIAGSLQIWSATVPVAPVRRSDERHRAGGAVLHVDVHDRVVVLVAQVVGAGGERDEAAVLADGLLGARGKGADGSRQRCQERRVAAEDLRAVGRQGGRAGLGAPDAGRHQCEQQEERRCVSSGDGRPDPSDRHPVIPYAGLSRVPSLVLVLLEVEGRRR